MPPRDSLLGTVLVALVLCVVCSLLVSTAAVVLKPTQEQNKALDKKKNILLAAGLCEPSSSSDQIATIYDESIVEKLIDLETGEVIDIAKSGDGATPGGADASDETTTEGGADGAGVSLASYDPRKAANDPELQADVEPAGALPGIAHREPYASVYEIQKDGQTDGYILPIYGKGLWSTLFGFLAIESDKETVRGITYYSHAETPGLGGEVDNAGWKSLWPGKKVYEEDGEVGLSVIKGKAAESDPYAIDGLSGATITSKGVDNMVKYWLGPDAFGKYLTKN